MHYDGRGLFPARAARKGHARRRRRCDVCGGDPAAQSAITALVPDSSFIDPSDHHRDGVRIATVCTAEELDELVAACRAKWRDEQLWLGQLARASTVPHLRTATLGALARRAGLEESQLARLLAWNARQDKPVTALPGGHSLGGSAPPG